MTPTPPAAGQGRERSREIACYLAILGAVCLVLAPSIFAGRAPLPDYLRYFAFWADGAVETAWNPLWYDAVGQYWPWRTLLADGLRHNQLPFWNPYQLNGYAFAGNGQSALFYPPNWLFFGLFSVPVGFRLTAVGHLWLAGAATFRLCRELGTRRPAALLAGLVFPLSGFMITWLMLPTLISSAAWLPVGAAAVERARRTGESRWAAVAGLAVGLSALAGHPQIFYYVAVTVLLLALLRLRLGQTALVAAVGLAIALAALMPVLELAPRSHRPPGRSDEGYQVFLGRSVPTEWLITLGLPRFFGSPARGTVMPGSPDLLRAAGEGQYWGPNRGAVSPGDYTEFNLYTGVLPPLLLLLAVATGPSAARGYAVLALLALALACGAPPNRWLYFGLPGYSAGAGPCRLALVWCFATAVCSGLVAERLPALGRRRVAVAAAACVALLVVAYLLAQARLRAAGLGPLLSVTGYRHLLGASVCLALLAAAVWGRHRPWLLTLLVALDLLAFGWRFNPSAPAALLDPRPAELAAAAPPGGQRLLVADHPDRWGFYRPPAGLYLPPNLATAAGLRDVGGYDSLLPAAAKQTFFALGNRHPSPATNGNMLLLGHLAGRAALVDGSLAAVIGEEPPRGARTAPGSRWLHVLPGPSSRLWSWSGAGAAPRAVAYRLAVDTANRVAVSISGGNPLWLDSPYPGWRCYLGPPGSAALAPAAWYSSPLPAPFDRGRFVPLQAQGTLRLQWVYSPTSVRLGLFLALLGLALTAAVVIASRGDLPCSTSPMPCSLPRA